MSRRNSDEKRGHGNASLYVGRQREGGRRRESGKSWRWRRIKRDGGREGRDRVSRSWRQRRIKRDGEEEAVIERE